MKKILQSAKKKVSAIDALVKRIKSRLSQNVTEIGKAPSVGARATMLTLVAAESEPSAVRAKRALYGWCYDFTSLAYKARGMERDARERLFHTFGIESPYTVKSGKRKGEADLASNVKQLIAWSQGWDYRANKPGAKFANRIKAIQWRILERARSYAKAVKGVKPLKLERETAERSAVRVVVDTRAVDFQNTNPEHVARLVGVFAPGAVKTALVEFQKQLVMEKRRIADTEAKKKAEATKAASDEALRASA